MAAGGITRRGRCTVEPGSVGAGRQLDAQSGIDCVVVILREAAPDLTGFDADDGVLPGVVIGAPAEDALPDDPLFEPVFLSREGGLHHISEELTGPLTGAEGRAREDVLQVSQNFRLPKVRHFHRCSRPITNHLPELYHNVSSR